MSEHPLQKVMYPRSMAFMGASNNITRMGSFQFINILAGGYAGVLYPVHPQEQEVMGVRAYPSLEALPEVPDVLMLVIPTRLVPGELAKAGRLGINRAIITTAGYEEMAAAEGRRLQTEIDETCARYGIRYVGPNCIGIFNQFVKLNTTPFPNRLPAGPIGLLSHSGTYLSHLFPYLEEFGFNIGEGISLGNEASLDLVDGLEYFAGNPNIKVIAMYIEGLRRGPEFIRVARRIAREKPLVALYAGGSEGGARSAATHTAALSGPDHLYDAAFRQAGVIRARTVEELLDFAWALAAQPLPAGDRMAVLSVSGGPGTSMADEVSRSGLELPVFSPGLQAKLLESLPHTGAAPNPVDVTYNDNPEVFMKILPRAILESDETDGLLFYGVFGPDWIAELNRLLGGRLIAVEEAALKEMGEAAAREFAELLQSFGKPVLGSTFLSDRDSMIHLLRRAGIPIYYSPERAVKAMAALCRYRRIREGLSS